MGIARPRRSGAVEHIRLSAASRAFGRDLTAEAIAGRLDPVIGRDVEIRRIAQVLSRRTKNNPVLIGDPGVGKTAIVEGLAQRIVNGRVPATLQGRSIFALELSALIAGATLRGEFEKRLRTVLDEIRGAEGRIVLFIDELHTMVGAGAVDGAMDAGNILKPMLARGELHCIGATTVEEYRKHVEKDAALERRFQPELIEESSVEDTVAILRGLRPIIAAHHGVRIADGALVAAARLSDRYINDRFLPDKAIDLVDEAGAALRTEIDSMPHRLDAQQQLIDRLEREVDALIYEEDPEAQTRLMQVRDELSDARAVLEPWARQWDAERAALTELATARAARSVDRGPLLDAARSRLAQAQGSEPLLHDTVTPDDIADVVSQWTGVPAARLLQGERDRLLALHHRLAERVVGQPTAVRSVADAIVRARSGVRDPRRPIGSFVFVGPTGVGKTELAVAVADVLFDASDTMLRFDMSEFQEGHAVARLIGAPPGYVGYDDGGQLTERVRRSPYAVVLFDEIEKAHPDVLTTLLQVLDEGRLTDARGRSVDFRNTVLIMTSNAGAVRSRTESGAFEARAREDVVKELSARLRQEFVARVDDIVVFTDLSVHDLEKIVDLLTSDLAERLEELGLTLLVSPAARRLLAERAWGSHDGARVLRRAVSHDVETRIGRAVLADPPPAGSRAVLDVVGGELAVVVSVPSSGATAAEVDPLDALAAP